MANLIETNQSIYFTNHLAGFYVKGSLALNKLEMKDQRSQLLLTCLSIYLFINLFTFYIVCTFFYIVLHYYFLYFCIVVINPINNIFTTKT